MFLGMESGKIQSGKKRNKNAFTIVSGACNPRAIVSAMQRAIDEMVTDGLCSSNQILADPALKLMVHQLAFLMNIPTGESFDEWNSWYNHIQNN